MTLYLYIVNKRNDEIQMKALNINFCTCCTAIQTKHFRTRYNLKRKRTITEPQADVQVLTTNGRKYLKKMGKIQNISDSDIAL